MVRKPRQASTKSAEQRQIDRDVLAYRKQEREAMLAKRPNSYNPYVLDQLYQMRSASYIKHFTARSISFLGYNPYSDGVYSFRSEDDEHRFREYWLCGHGIQHGKQYHADLLAAAEQDKIKGRAR